jgi:hypothetical protein
MYTTMQNKIKTTETKGILLNMQTVKDMGTPKIIATSNPDA